MGCLLSVQHLIDIPPQFLRWCMQYVLLNRVITVQSYTIYLAAYCCSRTLFLCFFCTFTKLLWILCMYMCCCSEIFSNRWSQMTSFQITIVKQYSYSPHAVVQYDWTLSWQLKFLSHIYSQFKIYRLTWTSIDHLIRDQQYLWAPSNKQPNKNDRV